MGTLTVRENLTFSAALRLPSYLSFKQRKEKVDSGDGGTGAKRLQAQWGEYCGIVGAGGGRGGGGGGVGRTGWRGEGKSGKGTDRVKICLHLGMCYCMCVHFASFFSGVYVCMSVLFCCTCSPEWLGRLC